MIEIFERGPVIGFLVVDHPGHVGSILRKLFVPQGDEKRGQTFPLVGGKSLDLGLDFLNTHVRIIDAGKFFATSQGHAQQGRSAIAGHSPAMG